MFLTERLQHHHCYMLKNFWISLYCRLQYRSMKMSDLMHQDEECSVCGVVLDCIELQRVGFCL